MTETNRIIPAERIKTEEEFKEHEANYKYCLGEQEWYAITKDPKKEVIDKLKKYIADLDSTERKSEKEQAILKDINLLQVKLELISNNSYDVILQENMDTELKLMREYKLSKRFNGVALTKALIKGDEEAKELWDYKVLRLSGRMGKLTSLDVIPNSSVVLDFVKMYKESFVDVNIEEVKKSVEQQIGLVIYQDLAGRFGDGANSRISHKITEINDLIKDDNGIGIEEINSDEKQNSGLGIDKTKGPLKPKEPSKKEEHDI